MFTATLKSVDNHTKTVRNDVNIVKSYDVLLTTVEKSENKENEEKQILEGKENCQNRAWGPH